MAPPAKITRKASDSPKQFKLSKNPFVEDSAKEKVQRWKIVAPTEGNNNEDNKALTLSENSSDLKPKSKKSSSDESRNSSKRQESEDKSTDIEEEDSESDKAKSKDSDLNKLSPKKKRQRSKTTGDARIVDWPTTPDKPKIVEREPKTAPAKPIVVTPKTAKERNNGLKADIKLASAPRKRVLSDGHWVRYRNLPPKEEPPKPPPKPKVVKLANGPAGLAWVRPPLLPRQSSTSEQPKPAAPQEAPPLKQYKGKLRKPIWHQFDIEKERARLEAKDAAANDAYDFRRGSKWKKAVPKEAESEGAESDDDTESLSDSDGRNSPDINRHTSIQRSPPQIYKKRKSKRRGSADDETRHSYKEPERIPLSSQPRRYSSIQRSPPTISGNAAELPNRYHRRGKSTGNLAETESEPSYVPLEERQKPSYNAGDLVPGTKEVPTHVPVLGLPGRLAAWLTTTPDPFTGPTEKEKEKEKEKETEKEKEKLKKPSFAKRLFSFEKDKSVSKTQTSSTTSQSQGLDGSPGQSSRSKGKDASYDTRTPTREQRKKNVDGVDPDIEVEYASSTSTPTIRRSGARRTNGSPTLETLKSPTFKGSADTESTTSVTSSSVVTSTVDSSSHVTPTNQHDLEPLSPRRPFPSTGKRLSTIVSVETMTTRHIQDAQAMSETSIATETPEIKPLRQVSISLPHRDSAVSSKEKDLLVIPNDRSSAMSRAKSVVSVRSTRSFRSRLANSSVPEVMRELAADEESFMPELRTLVGGVIKVLFRAVLSKSDAAVAAGLFSKFMSGQTGEGDAKRSIHEMGVALERLKSYHIRIPTENPKDFLIWAQGAHKIYAEYVRTWRLGFQDVVVELVPEDDVSTITGRDIDSQSMADAMPRNEKGYVINQQGEMVDVAFLLKRPLVRLKFLAKTIKSLNILQPTDDSEQLAKKYEELMETARSKVNTERARIEDQRAALVETRRARDPKTMGALSGVKIDPNRCVRARDFFDMHFIHSTGQEVLSRIEILLRDDPPKLGTGGGDLLLCQVDGRGKWLFLPPIMLKNISARKGGEADELIVMIRGVHSGGAEWRELMSLKSGEDDVATEWLQMLGTSPVPPPFSRQLIVKDSLAIPRMRPASSRGSSLLSGSAFTESTDQRETSRPPSPTATDILPVGERAGRDAKRWGSITPDRSGTASPVTPASSSLSAERGERKVSPSELYKSLGSGNHGTSKRHSTSADRRATAREEISPEPKDLNEAMNMAGRGLSGLRRTRATRHKPAPSSPTNPEAHTRRFSSMETTENKRYEQSTREHKSSSTKDRSYAATPSGHRGFSVWIPSSHPGEDPQEQPDDHLSITSNQAPNLHRRSSSMPLKTGSHSRARRVPDRYSSVSVPSSVESESDIHNQRQYDSLPTSPYEKRHVDVEEDSPPPPPPHRTPVKQSTSNKLAGPQLTPSAISSLKRRSSSPLKHEYQPSSESERSLSDDDMSGSYDDDDDFLASSESEDEENTDQRRKSTGPAQPGQMGDIEAETLTPSQSASQGPFRDVPQTQSIFFTTLAGISQWKNGEYVNLHGKECLVEVSAGKVAAYETSPSSHPPHITKLPNADPIIALHLTPGILVQITNVCDIMVRSKPTYDSQLQLKHGGGMHVRFHTRSPAIREALQDSIGRAMASNPTYIALERARPRETEAERFDRQNQGSNARAGGKSWWGGSRQSSFRKAQTRSGSTVGNTERTYRTTSSLKRSINQILTKATGFNIEKSAIFSKTRGSSGVDSRSVDGDGNPSLAPPPPSDAFARDFPHELQHTLRTAQCRVVKMEKSMRSRTSRNMGRATLHILHPPRKPTGSVAGVAGPEGMHEGNAVRVVLANRESVLMDQVLPPSCFYHTPRGITMHVFSEGEGGVRERGGVGTWAVQEVFLDGVSKLHGLVIVIMSLIFCSSKARV
jgi:hypothetical protein